MGFARNSHALLSLFAVLCRLNTPPIPRRGYCRLICLVHFTGSGKHTDPICDPFDAQHDENL
jgi:hypothetical protein